ncbi:hypothetical protein BDR22DRAFT_964344 [Usnea florida]
MAKPANAISSEDKNGVTALFEDGIEVTGSMLVGTDGPQLSVRSHLVEVDRAKLTPVDLATMICATPCWRDRALLRSGLYERFLPTTSHPNGCYGVPGLDGPSLHYPDSWSFTHYIPFADLNTRE